MNKSLPEISKTIKAHIRIENWRLVSAANTARLVVRGTKDISRNVLGRGFTPEYRELWVVMHEDQGYIWREITHGMGINGHHPTLRDLVRTTACLGYEIELLSEPLAKETLASVERNVRKLELR
jgi:hypothetical protein